MLHPNSSHLILLALLAIAIVLWVRARRRASTAERRLDRARARVDVLLLEVDETRDQLDDQHRAIATARAEARRHLHAVAS